MRSFALASLAGLCLLVAGHASAHGSTVLLSYGQVKPPRVTIRAGQTVHFRNASATPRTFTLKGGAFESPPLARGEDWHHEFPEPGSFPYAVVEFPDMRGEIVVAPPADD